MKDVQEIITTDALVVGGGCGTRAAIELSRAGVDVLLAVKGKVGRSGATPMAGADVMLDGASACRLGYPANPEDTPENFARDIVTEGLFLNNQALVSTYCREAGSVVSEIIDWGMKVLTFERAHGEENPRGIFTTGLSIANALRRELRKSSRVRVRSEMMILGILTRDRQVAGALGLDLQTGDLVLIRCRAVILSTGGWHQLYPFTSGSDDLTGDGQAMAFRAGCELQDMEMVQFCPNIILDPPQWRGALFLYWPIGGDVAPHLLNSLGNRFMQRWDKEHLEASTKEIVSLACAHEVLEGRGTPAGGAYYSLRHLPMNIFEALEEKYPGWVVEHVEYSPLMERLKAGYAVEVGPAAHFFMGGIKVDRLQQTSIAGLFAAGECAGGLWGANRIAAATTQILVQGKIAGREAANFCKSHEVLEPDSKQIEDLVGQVLSPFGRGKGADVFEIQGRIHEVVQKGLAVIREKSGLENVLGEEKELRRALLQRCAFRSQSRNYNMEWKRFLELGNLLDILRLSAASALVREESRGAHYRLDYPDTDNDNWLKNIVVRKAGKDDMGITHRCISVEADFVELPAGRMSYEAAIAVATSTME